MPRRILTHVSAKKQRISTASLGNLAERENHELLRSLRKGLASASLKKFVPLGSKTQQKRNPALATNKKRTVPRARRRRSSAAGAILGQLKWKIAREALKRQKQEQSKIYTLVRNAEALAEALTDEMVRELCSGAEQRTYKDGEFLFHQGEEGDGMYVVRTGRVEILRRPELDLDVATEQDILQGAQYKKLLELGKGSLFGETSILTKAPRNAAIRAVHGPVECVFISRDLYEKLKSGQKGQQMEEALARARVHIMQNGILDRIPVFATLSREVRDSLLSVMRPKTFSSGDYICRQGDKGYRLHVIIKGHARVTVNDPEEEAGERTLTTLSSPEYFGEIALLNEDCLRTANVIAHEGEVTTMVLHKLNFDAMINNDSTLRRTMQSNADAARMGLLSAGPENNDEDGIENDGQGEETAGSTPSILEKVEFKKSYSFIIKILPLFWNTLNRKNIGASLLSRIEESGKVELRVRSVVETMIEILKGAPEDRTDRQVAFLMIALKKSKLFRQHCNKLAPHQRFRLCKCMTIKFVKKGHPLYRNSKPAKNCYLVLTGALESRSARSETGRKSGLSMNCEQKYPGDVIGEICLQGVLVRMSTVVAKKSAALLALPSKEYMEIADVNPEFSKRFSVLRRIHALSDWPLERLYWLGYHMKEISAASGNDILKFGQNLTGLFIVMSGSVSIRVRTEVGELEVANYSHGAVFGSMGLLSVAVGDGNSADISSNFRAVAKFNCTLLKLPSIHYGKILHSGYATIDRLWKEEKARQLEYENRVKCSSLGLNTETQPFQSERLPKSQFFSQSKTVGTSHSSDNHLSRPSWGRVEYSELLRPMQKTAVQQNTIEKKLKASGGDDSGTCNRTNMLCGISTTTLVPRQPAMPGQLKSIVSDVMTKDLSGVQAANAMNDTIDESKNDGEMKRVSLEKSPIRISKSLRKTFHEIFYSISTTGADLHYKRGSFDRSDDPVPIPPLPQPRSSPSKRFRNCHLLRRKQVSNDFELQENMRHQYFASQAHKVAPIDHTACSAPLEMSIEM